MYIVFGDEYHGEWSGPWEEACRAAPTHATCPVHAVGQGISIPVFYPRRLAAGSLQVGAQELTAMDVMGPNG